MSQQNPDHPTGSSYAKSLTAYLEATSTALHDVAPAMTAIHNMLADVAYTGYAISTDSISIPLLAMIWCVRFPGSVILLAGNGKAAEYVKSHDGILSSLIGAVQKPAKQIVARVEGLISDGIKERSPGNFTIAFAAYAVSGAEVCREGLAKLTADPQMETHLSEMISDVTSLNFTKALSNPLAPALFQFLAGLSVTAGCSSYAVSGLQAVKDHPVWHHRLTKTGEVFSLPTALLNGSNAAMAGGPTTVRGALLTVLTYLNCAQIATRRFLHSKIDDPPNPSGTLDGRVVIDGPKPSG